MVESRSLPSAKSPKQILLSAFFAGLTYLGRAEDPGIYADFRTSQGDFTCRLEYTNAPLAVANFIGLATGARPWLDLTTGQVRTEPFYDGLTFHRVIAGFMSQTGSRNGVGTDDPGYAFIDEISPNLKHLTGTLAMANSGKNSNGAQIYVTAAPQPLLDGNYTVFGDVVSGMATVTNSINRVATDPKTERPLVDVVLNTVKIRRVGLAAAAFDINAQPLPIVSQVPLQINYDKNLIDLKYTHPENGQLAYFFSTNLNNWSRLNSNIRLIETTNYVSTYKATNSVEFYRIGLVQYPTSTRAPEKLWDRQLTLNFTKSLNTNTPARPPLTIQFDGSNRGAFQQGTNRGTVSEYVWQQGRYKGTLQPIRFSDLTIYALRFEFETLTNGTFVGNRYLSTVDSVSGGFSINP